MHTFSTKIKQVTQTYKIFLQGIKGAVLLSGQTLIQQHNEYISYICGPLESKVSSVCTPDHANTSSLCFVSNEAQLRKALDGGCPLIFVPQDLSLTLAIPSATLLLGYKNLKLCMSQVLKHFDHRPQKIGFSPGFHSTAIVHPTASVGLGVTVGPYSVIGANCKIGANTHIGPFCYFEDDVEIGENCYFQSHVQVGYRSCIGAYCNFKSHSIIGSDGYGYVPASSGHKKIPQVGRVIIEDHVDIGASVCIDRATIGETRIGQGTKIDNVVHIAHNCNIGKNCFITAGFATAGSTQIGDNFVCGGQCSVGDHVQIAANVTLAGASVVLSDIKESGTYGGHPVQPLQEYLKTSSSLLHLSKMRKQINKILKQLNLTD